MSTRDGFVHCHHDGCPATHPNHRWGRTKAAGWFTQRDEERSWCPEHLPEWVAEWRARRAARQEERPAPPTG